VEEVEVAAQAHAHSHQQSHQNHHHSVNGVAASGPDGAGFFHLYELRVLAPNADPDRDAVGVVGGAEVLGQWTLANACECTYDANEGVWVLHLPLPASCLANPDELSYKVRTHCRCIIISFELKRHWAFRLP
jgi:hypothetical protein